jgi:hypothetical protein
LSANRALLGYVAALRRHLRDVVSSAHKPIVDESASARRQSIYGKLLTDCESVYQLLTRAYAYMRC